MVIWGKRALTELKAVYDYISFDSPLNAKNVIEEIVDFTEKTLNNPEKHPIDPFKKLNDGSWRVFEKYSYRISYRVLKNKISIVRIRHTSRSPRYY